MQRVIAIYECEDDQADALARTLYWDAQLNQQRAYDCELICVNLQDPVTLEYRPPKSA